MSIIKYIANADTTITNAFKPNTTVRAFYSNLGAADSLELFSIAHTGSTAEKSRILLRFPIEKIEQHRASGVLPQSGSINFILKLYNVEHPETVPRNYDVLLKPISGSWEEGDGLDIEYYSDIGQTDTIGYGVGWKYRSTTDYPFHWLTDGGDFWPGYDKVFHFDSGLEDIEVDVTDIIEAQLDNTISRDGIALMLSGSFEDNLNGENYYTKRFSSRSSEYYYKTPSIEARWESVKKDDRGNFYFKSDNLTDQDNQQNIYFYNKVNGRLKNLPLNSVPFVKIIGPEGNQLTSSVPSVNVSTGVYKASLSITGSEDTDLSDVWYSGSHQYYSGVINAKIRTFSDSENNEEYVFSINNLKKTYKNEEYPSLRVFCRYKNWSPNVYKIATTDIESLCLDNLYYKAYRIVDGETIIDYGIDPIAYTKCSYDKNGNYFNLDMSFFEPGYAYAIKLMTVDQDIKREYGQVFRFKVE